MRPFFPYYGSKWNMSRYFPRPDYGHVVEPFAGGAGYSTFYEPMRVTLIDADPIICGVWRYLLGASADEILALPELPEVGDCVDNYPLSDGAKWLIGFWLNRGSAQPKKSRTAYSARTDKAQLNWGAKAKERIAEQLPMISQWSVVNASYERSPGIQATWFVDPPYGDKGKFYRVGFIAHRALGEWCRTRTGQVIACAGMDETWLPFTKIGSFKTSKGRADEAIWHRNGT